MTADGVLPATKIPTEPNCYVLYVIAGCPFATCPSGHSSHLQSSHISLPPRTIKGGSLLRRPTEKSMRRQTFQPEAQIDLDPLPGSHHLKQLYTNGQSHIFKGAVSVPLLWDKDQDTAGSNPSLGLTEMQYQGMATCNQNLGLHPSDTAVNQEHLDLVKFLHSKMSTAVGFLAYMYSMLRYVPLVRPSIRNTRFENPCRVVHVQHSKVQ